MVENERKAIKSLSLIISTIDILELIRQTNLALDIWLRTHCKRASLLNFQQGLARKTFALNALEGNRIK